MYLRLAVLALAIPAVACTSNPRGDETASDPGSARAALVASVDSAMHAYLLALTSHDAEGVVSHYANDPEFVAYIDGIPVDYATQSSNVRTLFGGIESIALEPVTVVVTPLTGDLAIASFTFRQVLTDTAGVATHLKGAASWVWRRNGSGWTLIHGHGVHYPDSVAQQPKG